MKVYDAKGSGLTKFCSKCGQTKPIAEFGCNRSRKDGRQAYCTTCRRAHRSANRKSRAAALKRWRDANPGKTAEHHKRHSEAHRKRHPKRTKARWAVGNAIRDGRLSKPGSCEGCGGLTPSRKLHGHHDDYDKPLDVRWLCSICHGEADAKRREHELDQLGETEKGDGDD